MNNVILEAINSVETTEEVNEIIDLIKWKQKSLRKSKSVMMKSVLGKGTKVEVAIQNEIFNGVVVKVNRTKSFVTIPNYNGRPTADYTVPLTMLRKVA